jgi:hypothetical protein
VRPGRNDTIPQGYRQQITPVLVGIEEIMVSIVEIRNSCRKGF